MTVAPEGPSRVARTVRIGITGPIGCGKSTVARWLGELGAVVIDADQATRTVTEPGSAALSAIVSAFGDAVLRDDGTLDRPALGRIVFTEPTALAELEAIVHPAVRPVILAEMEAAADDGAPAVVVEAIKLVEGGLAELCDEVWLITCSAESQLQRLTERASARGVDPTNIAAHRADPTELPARRAGPTNLAARRADRTELAARVPDGDIAAREADATDIAARVAAQSGLADRLAAVATRILDTSGTPSETRTIVAAAYAAALAGADSLAGTDSLAGED